MITICDIPIPVYVEGLGDAYVVYIKANGMFENDEVCVALCDGGQWRHVLVNQIKSHHNATYSIKKKEESK